jgi:hypothetical protein
LRVKQKWLEEGAAIQFQVPRNLTCAACDGGGCDTCGRSGAISLRARGEPGEVLTVTLPRCDASSGNAGVVLRIPEQGGFVQQGPPLPRGMLLLSVSAGERADAGVSRIRATLAPPQGVGMPSQLPILQGRARVALWVIWLLVAALLAWLAVGTFFRV